MKIEGEFIFHTLTFTTDGKEWRSIFTPWGRTGSMRGCAVGVGGIWNLF